MAPYPKGVGREQVEVRGEYVNWRRSSTPNPGEMDSREVDDQWQQLAHKLIYFRRLCDYVSAERSCGFGRHS